MAMVLTHEEYLALSGNAKRYREQRDQLREALEDLLPIASNGAATPSHAGGCGPESSCDTDCMAAVLDAEYLSKARAALKATED